MAILLLSVMEAFAKFERSLIKEIALAKQRDAYGGRKKTLSDEEVEELFRRVKAGEMKTRVAHDFVISKETLYQYLRSKAFSIG